MCAERGTRRIRTVSPCSGRRSGIVPHTSEAGPALLKTSSESRCELMSYWFARCSTSWRYFLSVFASLFKSTERLGAKNLIVPTENLILYDQRLKGPSRCPICGCFAAGTRRDFGVIAKDLRPAHTWDALAKTGRW